MCIKKILESIKNNPLDSLRIIYGLWLLYLASNAVITLILTPSIQVFQLIDSLITYSGTPLFILFIAKTLLQLITGIMVLRNKINKWNTTYLIAYFIASTIILLTQAHLNYVHLIEILMAIGVMLTLYLAEVKSKNSLIPVTISILILTIGEAFQPLISSGKGFITLQIPYLDILIAILGLLIIFEKLHKITIPALAIIVGITLANQLVTYFSLISSNSTMIIWDIIDMILLHLIVIFGLLAIYKEKTSF